MLYYREHEGKPLQGKQRKEPAFYPYYRGRKGPSPWRPMHAAQAAKSLVLPGKGVV
jgi:hypothetical protein